MKCTNCQKPFATGRDQLCFDCANTAQEHYLWMQLESARCERERARTALREIRKGIANEEEHGLWDADAILGIIDRALSPEKPTRSELEVSASWVPYGRGKFALMLDPTKRVPTDAVALVKPAHNEPGRYFWEHYPFMGQWGMADSLEEAKDRAGCPWKSLWQNSRDIPREASESSNCSEI